MTWTTLTLLFKCEKNHTTKYRREGRIGPSRCDYLPDAALSHPTHLPPSPPPSPPPPTTWISNIFLDKSFGHVPASVVCQTFDAHLPSLTAVPIIPTMLYSDLIYIHSTFDKTSKGTDCFFILPTSNIHGS